MKAKDLRVGNIVYYFSDNSDTWFNDRVLSENDMICLLSDNGDHAENIPITDSWLLKFGFEHKKTIGGYSKWSNKKMRLLDMKFYFDSSEYFIRIRYVHQLQNLYHALTGEELTLPKQAPQSPKE